MKSIIHERPGVYSSYDTSASVRGGRAVRTIGVAAKSTGGTANTAVRLTRYEMWTATIMPPPSPPCRP